MNISALAYTLYAGTNIVLSAEYRITDVNTELILSKSYLFEKSLSAWVRPPEPVDQQHKTFLFVMTSKDVI